MASNTNAKRDFARKSRVHAPLPYINPRSNAFTSSSILTRSQTRKMAEEQQKMKIKLVANDGKTFEVDEDVAFKSQMIKDMCSNLGVSDNFEVPITEVDGKTMEKVIEYCTEYRTENYKKKGENEDQRIDLTEKHKAYLNVSDDFVVEMLTAANYLDIPGLIDIICQHIANMIRGKNPEEIRHQYDLPDDLTEEEKKEVRKMYEWLDI